MGRRNLHTGSGMYCRYCNHIFFSGCCFDNCGFFKNAKQASSISPIVAVPLSFIAGAFIPLPDCVIATINNQQIQIYEILP